MRSSRALLGRRRRRLTRRTKRGWQPECRSSRRQRRQQTPRPASRAVRIATLPASLPADGLSQHVQPAAKLLMRFCIAGLVHVGLDKPEATAAFRVSCEAGSLVSMSGCSGVGLVHPIFCMQRCCAGLSPLHRTLLR